MPRKKETLTLSVPPGTKEKLETIADRLDIRWGKSPSPSGLVAAIAQEDVVVGTPFTLNASQVNALQQAVRELVDTGYIEEAKSVITLLIERGVLETPLRHDLIRQVGQFREAWRLEVDQFIENQQPFTLLYQDSQGQTLEYSVRYAEVLFIEKRYYLQIWCDETEDSQDLPELQHNRCLRLDRIQSIVPLNGSWRGHFDSIEVQLQFKGRLVKAYEFKTETGDVEQEFLEGIRLVTRRVVNPFWLIREVMRYGRDCTIISPKSVRDRFKQELLAMLAQYDSGEGG